MPLNSAATRRPAYVLGAAVLAVGLAACGGGGSKGSSGSADTATVDKMTVDQLYAQAKQEGKANWYTSMPQASLTALVAAFEKKYPGVEIAGLFLGGNQSVTRVQTEARGGKVTADVVSGSGDAVLLSQAGLLDTGYTPKDLPKMPAGLSLGPGVGPEKLITNVIMYNPQAVKAAGLAAPTALEDFTKPEWRGKFSVDPVTADIVNCYMGTMGKEKVLALMSQLGANSPLFVTSHSLGASQVASGTVLAMVGAYGQDGVKYSRQDPEKAAFVNPSPLPTNVSEVAVVKGGPHPAAGRLFMDWLVSKDGQAEVVKNGMVSVRDDVENEPTEWDPAKWAPAFEEVNLPSAERAKSLAEYQAAVGYHG